MTAKRFTPSQSIIEGTCVDSNQKSPSAYTFEIRSHSALRDNRGGLVKTQMAAMMTVNVALFDKNQLFL